MRFMPKLLNIGVIAALAGCAAGPRPEVDAGKFRAVHTVTVVDPGKAAYSGGRGQMPLLFAGGGVLGAVVTGAVTGLANASSAKYDPRTFDDLVTAKLGDTKLNRRLTDGIEAALRAHGYVVREVDASTPTLPTFSRDEHNQWQWHAGGPVYRDSDAVLLIRVSPLYNSGGAMSAYSRLVVGEIVMFTGDTHEAVFRQPVYWQKAIDPYSYHTIDAVVADLPHAISGLDESVMAQVDLFDKSLDSIQH
jgi:hypothetical protein